MTITDYYKDYKANSKPAFVLNDTPIISKTIEDFYNDSIKKCLINKKNVIAWHKMLMEYVDLPDAIYWIRYYESSVKRITSERYKNRRACYTKFSDGFSYVFVSNFDAHEIFNMVAKGVVPSANEFLNLMKTFSFPMHYCQGKDCEESDIVAYPHVGYHKAGTMTAGKWYLAHINAVKSSYTMPDGSNRKLTNTESEHLFPRGVLSDWKYDSNIRKMVRNLPYALNDNEKAIVRAHFLRFIDPLNYFLTPSTSNEIDSVTAQNKNIGEFENLTVYMQTKYKAFYGVSAINEFTTKALVPQNTIYENGSSIINVEYGKTLNNKSSSNANKSAKSKNASLKTSVPGQQNIGSYAKGLFINLLETNKLTNTQISNLLDKNYCSKEFKISFPILVECNTSFDKKRYYKNLIINKYYLCSQWIERQRPYIEKWKLANNL